MIGIVVVSHSPRLAKATVDLALEMVPGDRPKIAIAAGSGDGLTGTDAVRVSQAISEVASPDGVLVLMDLGSAVLSAEMALEFLPDREMPVRLTSAPFVEGLLAAIVVAAGGGTLDAVDAEARGALAAKRSHLGQETAATTAPVDVDGEARDFTIMNPDGLHARPAAVLVGAIASLEASVSVSNTTKGTQPIAVTGPTALLTLGSRKGDVLHFTASGTDATAALDALGALIAEGFGELDAPTTLLAVPRTGPLGVSAGRAVGPVRRMAPPIEEPEIGEPIEVANRDAEAARLAPAVAAVEASITERAARVDGDARAILEANAAMVVDPTLFNAARTLVLVEGLSAERAAWQSVSDFADNLAALGGRMAERVTDVHDLRNRLVASLRGLSAPGVPESGEPFVLVAHDLAPADTALLDPASCLAIVTEEGGPTSHTAILARSLGIPAVVAAAGAMSIAEGTIVLVNGSTGRVEIDPSPELIAEVSAAVSVAEFNGTGATLDGHVIPMLANVGSPASVGAALDAGAEGIGLFRTEFCFLDRETAPTVEEQVASYQPVFAAFAGRKVIVRTLDAGADKPLAFANPAHEDNPALGIRGLRTALRHPQLLDDQLRAIAIAAAAETAQVQVMAPMVSTVDEARAFAASCREHGLASTGVMIETPAAAVMAKEIGAEVDFVSLGTNDLAQYTMAADRLIGDLAELNDPWQPAVLRLVQLSAKAGVPVGVCGEAAADPLLAAVLVGLGVSSLSMTPRAIAGVASLLGSVTLAQCVGAASAAVSASNAFEARAAAAAAMPT